MVEWFWPASCRAGFANAMTSVSSQKGRAWTHAKRSTVSQKGIEMTPLYGFGDKAVRKKTINVIALYVAKIKIIGPQLAKRRKWSKPLFLSAMRGWIISDTPAISNELGKTLFLWYLYLVGGRSVVNHQLHIWCKNVVIPVACLHQGARRAVTISSLLYDDLPLFKVQVF